MQVFWLQIKSVLFYFFVQFNDIGKCLPYILCPRMPPKVSSGFKLKLCAGRIMAYILLSANHFWWVLMNEFVYYPIDTNTCHNQEFQKHATREYQVLLYILQMFVYLQKCNIYSFFKKEGTPSHHRSAPFLPTEEGLMLMS